MRCDVYKKTTDDWCPSYSLFWYEAGHEREKVVSVTFCQTGQHPPIDGDWRVCVWGSDDCGMERDFQKENEAWCCFLEVIGLEDVTMDALKERGFVSA